MKKKLILLLFVLASLGSWAQMVKPFAVNSAGGSATIGGNTYDWSFAEMTIVGTAATSNLIVTQGLLQPIDPNVGTNEFQSLSEWVKVYPSPTIDILNLETLFDFSGRLKYQLVDMSGKVITTDEVKVGKGNSLTTLSLASYPAGEYLFKVLFLSQSGNGNYSQSFKIQKLQ